MTTEDCQLQSPIETQIKRRKRGFTLTEIAIVLGIIGIILGAIWVAAGAVYNNQHVAQTTRDVLSLAQGVRTMYSQQSLMETGTPITTTQLISSGVVPPDMNNAGTALVSVWGTAVVFTPATTIATAGDSFTLEFQSVPQAACVGLLTDSSISNTSSGLYAMQAKATAMTTVAQIGTTTNFTPAAAVTACASATANYVSFAFSIH